jgi:polyhydroxybutyrate depolymerase
MSWTRPGFSTARNVRLAAVSMAVLNSVGCSQHSAQNAAADAQASLDAQLAVDAQTSLEDAGGDSPHTPGDANPGDAGSSLPSRGCADSQGQAYPVGTTAGQLDHHGAARSFRVHVPPGYDGTSPRPLVLMFHGGGGSGRQFEQASSRMDPIADREQFIAVYPDGTGTLRTWNGGGCCGSAVQNNVDDVGFVAALLDHLETELCVDRRRAFASGMSNGAILSHRLACELADRIAAIAPVAGTDMTSSCTPARPIPVLHIHGTDDGHVPWDGGEGCGPAGVPFTSVPDTMERWRTRNSCGASTGRYLEQGDGRCEAYAGCAGQADLVLCSVAAGGHNWPGGDPPAGIVPCPGNGGQSATFQASEVIWSFFAAHPLPAH